MREFLTRQGLPAEPPDCGLLGKLVGELVAVLAMEIGDDAVEIRDLVVDAELRRKRIGRVMLSELDALASRMERRWLVAKKASATREFLSRVGFVEEGERMMRRVS